MVCFISMHVNPAYTGKTLKLFHDQKGSAALCYWTALLFRCIEQSPCGHISYCNQLPYSVGQHCCSTAPNNLPVGTFHTAISLLTFCPKKVKHKLHWWALEQKWQAVLPTAARAIYKTSPHFTTFRSPLRHERLRLDDATEVLPPCLLQSVNTDSPKLFWWLKSKPIPMTTVIR